MSRPLRSLKKQDDRRLRRRRRLVTFAVLVVVVIGGLAWLSRLDGVTIQTVAIEGETVTSERELSAVVDEVLAGNWLLLFPRRNGLLYPAQELKAAVLAAFPRVAKVDVDMPNLQTIVLALSEREPYALWCTKSAGGDPEESCYFLDREGVVFARAPDFSGTGYFTYYGPLMGESVIGGRFMEFARFQQVIDFLNALGTFADTPVSFTLANDGHDYEVALGNGVQVLLSAAGDLTTALGNIRSALAAEAIAEAAKEGKALESIDVRFGNRVYYRVK